MQMQADNAAAYLRDWYGRRRITDPYIQEAVNLDMPSIMQNLRSRPNAVTAPSIGYDPRVSGQYDATNNTLFFTPTARPEVPLHEVTHYANQAGAGGGYMRTIHKDIVKNELKPRDQQQGVYRDKFDYFANPDEVHARVMVLRKKAKFQPDQTVTADDLDSFLKSYDGKSENINDILNMSKGKPALLNMLNFMAAAPSQRRAVA